jgi:hypothetical protein
LFVSATSLNCGAMASSGYDPVKTTIGSGARAAHAATI